MAETTSYVSIAPLLRTYSRQKSVPKQDFDASEALLASGQLSELQKAVFLAFIILEGREHNEEQECDWQNITSDVPEDLQEHPNVAKLFDLLGRGLGPSTEEISQVFAQVLDGYLPPKRSAIFLALLAYTDLDRKPDVLAECARLMRERSTKIDRLALQQAVKKHDRHLGNYNGGPCDIVGTGGDGHSTFNVSTTASIISAAYLLLAKHGNRASSSTSGSADLLQAVKPEAPRLDAVNASTLPRIYANSAYAFLFAPQFHPAMRHIAPIRKEIGIKTIFNVLGPLVNPVNDDIEARIVGVAERNMGPVFAETLRVSGVKRAMVVCGNEDLDEISCAGQTHCWLLKEADSDTTNIESFTLCPVDFGLHSHSLSDVAGGKLPDENAQILSDLLNNKLLEDDPILDFVLMNAGALLAVSGVCDSAEAVLKDTGPGNLRLKEGVRLARESIRTGAGREALQKYIQATRNVNMID